LETEDPTPHDLAIGSVPSDLRSRPARD